MRPTFPLLYRYVAREILSPFLTALFVFTGILFLIKSLALIDMVVNKNVALLDIALLFSYIIPRFLEIALPMSILLGIILAFGRLSADSELVVIRATGISIRELAKPVLFFSGTVCLLTLIMGMWIRPWANHRLGVGMFEIAKMQASSGLLPGVFNELGQLTIYAGDVEQPSGRLQNVVLSDRRDPTVPKTFVAKDGQIVSDDLSRTLMVRLYDGSIHEGGGLHSNVTYFDINNISLEHDELLEGGPAREGKREKEMFLGELLSTIQTYQRKAKPLGKKDFRQLNRYKVELHRRFVIPFSCLCVAFVALALGVQPSRGGKAWGAVTNVVVGVMVVVTYYILLAFATALGEQGSFPPWLVMWTPNILFVFLARYLFQKIGSEQWLAVSEAFGEFCLNIRNRFSNDSQGKRKNIISLDNPI